jgi:hypothetical protein
MSLEQPEAVENEELPAEEVAEEITPEEVPEMSADEEKARRNGWRPQDEFNVHKDDWVTFKQFNKNGEMIAKVRKLEANQHRAQQEFETRLANNNKLTQAMIKEKEQQLEEAVQMADVGKVKAIQGQIDDLKAPTPQPQAPVKDPIVSEWEERNAWVNNPDDPKTPYANSRYTAYLRQGKSNEEALNLVDADIASAFPNTNPRRNNAPTPERSVSKPGKKATQKLSMKDVTHEEQKFRHMFKSEAEFLQSVSDIRKGS